MSARHTLPNRVERAVSKVALDNEYYDTLWFSTKIMDWQKHLLRLEDRRNPSQ